MSSMSLGGGSGWSASVSGTSGTQQTGGGRHGGGGLLRDAAKALGMSAGDAMSALKSGKSLDDLAADQGMSHDDLVTALKANMPQQVRDSADVDAIVEKATTTKGVEALRPPQGARGPQGTRGPGGPGGPPPAGPPPGDEDDDDSTGVLASSLTSTQSTTLDSLAALLGTDSTSLLDDLRSGTSLSDLVASQGVDSGALANVLENGLLYDQRL